MTLVAVAPTVWPHQIYSEESINNAGSLTATTFNTTSHQIIYVGEFRYADTITEVYFRLGTVTTGCTLELRIETLNSSGRPSGTLFGTNTNNTVVVTAGTDSNSWKSVTLTSAASGSVGGRYAIVIKYSSGSTPNMQFVQPSVTLFSDNPGFPYKLLSTDGGSTYSEISGSPLMMFVKYGTNGVVWHSGLSSMDGQPSVRTYSSSTNPNERAIKFSVPFKCRVYGAKFVLANPPSGGSYSLSLWPSSSSTDANALAQVTCSTDLSVNTTNDTYRTHLFSPVTLNPGTYYLGVRADNTTSIVQYEFAVSTVTAGAIGAIPSGSSAILATRNWSGGTAGSWSEDSNALMFFHLLIDQLDDGAGGGGGLAIPVSGRLVA